MTHDCSKQAIQGSKVSAPWTLGHSGMLHHEPSTLGDGRTRQQKFCKLGRISGKIWFKGPLKYLLMPLLGKNQLAITQHMYASIGRNLDNTHRGQI